MQKGDIIVYHGATEIVERPICKLGRLHLDFGQGFYLTDIKDQAVAWAKLVADRREKTPLLNRYVLNRNELLEDGRSLVFEAYNYEWLNFVVGNRLGKNLASSYDYVEGGVADDRVIDTVNLYMAGLMDVNTALARLSEHRPNNQICILNQRLVDKYLKFDGTETI